MARWFIAVGPIGAILVTISLFPSLPAQEKEPGIKEATPFKKKSMASQPGAFPGGPGGPMVGPSMPVMPGKGGGMGRPGPGRRFDFAIDPKAPLKALLPIPPTAKAKTAIIVADDVSQAPEIAFEDPLQHNDARALEKTAHQIAKIHHLNQNKPDAFTEALFAREDLNGLPLLLGQACRTKTERSRLLSHALETIRSALNQQITMPLSEARHAQQRAADQFWIAYQSTVLQEDRVSAAGPKEAQDDLLMVRIAALMQVLAPESSALRKGLVRHL